MTETRTHATGSPAMPAARTRRNPVTSHLLESQLVGTLAIYGLFVAGVVLLGVGIWLLSEVTGSIWSGALGLARWYALAVGIFVIAHHLPLYLTHGRTRREVATGGLVLAAALVPMLGALFALGYGIEAGIYHLAGWTDALPDPHPLGSLSAAVTTWAQQSVAVAGFAAVGALCAAAFYRHGGLGVATLPVGLAAVGVNTALLDGSLRLPIVGSAVDATGALVALALGLTVAMGAATWPILRDVPLRPESS